MTRDPLFLVSVYLAVAVSIRCFKPNLLSAVLLAVVMISSTAYMGRQHGEEIMLTIYKARDLVLSAAGKPPTWPPEKHRTYPDLELIDQDGKLTRLSEFKGRVVLIEPVGMSCPACVAFSGGHQYGPFDGTVPQANLDLIEKYAEQFGGIRLNDPRIVFVQLLLFNPAMQPPTPEEVAAWAEHFNLRRSRNQVVLGGTSSLASAASRAIVPGFQLLDKDLVLRRDSTGEQPKDNLYTDLLPAIQGLLKK